MPITAETRIRRANPDISQDEHVTTADGFSVLDLLTILARKRFFISKFTLGAGAIATLLAVLLPTRYTASTTFLPPSQGQPTSSALLAQLGGGASALGALGGASLGLKNPLDLQISLLRSEDIERKMIQRFNLMNEFHTKRISDARKLLEQKVSVTAEAKDGLIHLSVTTPSAERSAELANGYVDEFRSLTSRLAISEAAQRRLFFERQLQQEKETLTQAEQDLKQSEKTSGLIEAGSQTRSLIQSAATLQGQIAAQQVQVDSMRSYAGPGNVDLLQAERQLAGLHSELAKLSGVGNDAAGALTLNKGQLSEASLDYIRKVRDVKYHETLFEILARQFESARLDEAREGAPVQVIDVAYPPDRRSFPPHALLILPGLFVGFFVGCVLAALKSGLEGDPVHAERLRRLKAAFSS